MDITLQRHCARYIYVVPEGLRELMSDISREVLRSQPEDIYTFIADYLDALLITRENARVSARFVQYLSNASETIVELLSATGMSREEANKSATVIQDAFRAWSDRKGILKEDEETMVAKIIEDAGISQAHVQAAALVIQHAFRAFKARQQKDAQILSGIIDWRVAARSAIRLYRKTGVSPEEAKKAANLIKAAYKGYYTRRAIRLLNEEQTGEEAREEGGSVEDSGSQLSSSLTDERKSKGVRIDYTSVVPHVDFGGEELISRDLTSIIEEEVVPLDHKDVMARIFSEESKNVLSTEEYIKEIINDILLSVTSIDAKVELPIFDDKDSEGDIFIPAPTEEPEKEEYKRASIVPIVSQDELELELQEARREMILLKQTSVERHTVEGSETDAGHTISIRDDLNETVLAPPPDLAEETEEREIRTTDAPGETTDEVPQETET